MALKTRLPESIIDPKEYCFKCGRILAKGGRGIKVTIESVCKEEASVALETEEKYFCERCAKSGISVSVKDTGKPYETA